MRGVYRGGVAPTRPPALLLAETLFLSARRYLRCRSVPGPLWALILSTFVPCLTAQELQEAPTVVSVLGDPRSWRDPFPPDGGAARGCRDSRDCIHRGGPSSWPTSPRWGCASGISAPVWRGKIKTALGRTAFRSVRQLDGRVRVEHDLTGQRGTLVLLVDRDARGGRGELSLGRPHHPRRPLRLPCPSPWALGRRLGNGSPEADLLLRAARLWGGPPAPGSAAAADRRPYREELDQPVRRDLGQSRPRRQRPRPAHRKARHRPQRLQLPLPLRRRLQRHRGHQRLDRRLRRARPLRAAPQLLRLLPGTSSTQPRTTTSSRRIAGWRAGRTSKGRQGLKGHQDFLSFVPAVPSVLAVLVFFRLYPESL